MKKSVRLALFSVVIISLALGFSFIGTEQVHAIQAKVVYQAQQFLNLSVGKFTAVPKAQTLLAGETIISSAFHIALSSSPGAVTTGTTTSIADGTANGQLIWIENVNTYANPSDCIITIDTNAKTVISTGNLALAQGKSVWLHWNGTCWTRLFTN